jgi:His-Xaa-Ser system radical SAM maturase HxsC
MNGTQFCDKNKYIFDYLYALMLTEACNCLCLICPQPPKKHDPVLYSAALKVLDLIKNKDIENICITSGEPTVIDGFSHILGRCNVEHPDANVSILTNAKRFTNIDFTKKDCRCINKKKLFCISIHSDIYSTHDKIVASRGSLKSAQSGIYNLAKYNADIEIRHVITRLNYNRLHEFAEHMYRYFPFCAHYVFMSIGLHELADKNRDMVYIDPYEYKDMLRKAVISMRVKGFLVSIYNTSSLPST